jgi:hypothetical protein
MTKIGNVQGTTLNQPQLAAELTEGVGRLRIIEIGGGRCAMRIAFEINFALWIMMGCVIAETLGYLN